MKTSLVIFIFFIAILKSFPQSFTEAQESSDECYMDCGRQIQDDCFCDCLIRSGRRMLSNDSVIHAFERFNHAESECPEKEGGEIADSLVQNFRDWKYNGSKYAIVNFGGNEITQYQYANPSRFRYGYAFFEVSGKYFFVDKDGSIIRPHESVDGIVSMRGNVYGLVKDKAISSLALKKNPNQLIMIPGENIHLEFPEEKGLTRFTDFMIEKNYEVVYGPFQGVGGVLKKGRYGLVHKDGRELAPTIYKAMGIFHDNRVWVKGDENQKFGFLNNNGKEVIPTIYDTVGNFTEGFAIVRQGANWGFIDTIGSPLGRIEYEAVSHFRNGWAWFKKGSRWGILARDGRVVQPPIYEYAGSDHFNGFFFNDIPIENIWDREMVSKEGRDIFLYRSGDKIVEFPVKSNEYTVPGSLIRDLQEGRVAKREFGNDTPAGVHAPWKLYDTLNNKISDTGFIEIGSFYMGLAPAAILDVQGEMLYGAINRSGDWVVDPQFLVLYVQLALVFGPDRRGILNIKSKEIVISDLAQEPIFTSNNLIWAGIIQPNDSVLYALYTVDAQRILPPRYTSIGDFSEGLAAVRRDGLCGYINEAGVEIIKPRYEKANSFHNGLALVKIKDRWHYINRDGVVITRTFSGVNNFSESLYSFGDERRNIGFKDVYGNWTVPPLFREVRPMGENVCTVQTQKGRWGMINGKGVLILDTVFIDIDRNFYNGLAVVIDEKRRMGYVRTDGFLIEPIYKDVKNFSEGLAWVEEESGKWLIIDTLGNIRSEPLELEVSSSFSGGYSIVRYGGNWKIINKEGKLQATDFPLDYDFIDTRDGFQEGYAKVKKNEQYGFIDPMGKLVIPCKYKDAFIFKEGLVAVYNGSKWGVVDANDSIRVSFKYGEIRGFVHGVALVRKDTAYNDLNGQRKTIRRWGVIDAKDSILVPIIYHGADYGPKGGLFYMELNGDISILDQSGKTLLPSYLSSFPKYFGDEPNILFSREGMGVLYPAERKVISPDYEDICQVNKNLVMVRKNGKWGWVDHAGFERIPCQYDAAMPFIGGAAWVYRFGIQYYIDESGEMTLW